MKEFDPGESASIVSVTETMEAELSLGSNSLITW